MIGYELSNPATDDEWPTFRWDLPETFNVADVCLDHPAARTALRYVDEFGDETALTYGDIERAVADAAAALSARDIGKGDAVGVCLPQCPELLVVHLATLSRGGVVVPLSMLLGDEHAGHALDHADASALVVDRAKADELSIRTPPETVVVEPEPARERDALGGLGGTLVTDEDASSDQARLHTVETTPDDPAFVLYTSGTTGAPKGVVQGHRYLIGSLPGYQCWFELFDREAAAESRAWTPAEWAWAGALFDVVYPTLVMGGTVVARERRSGFDPERASRLVDRTGVTHTFLPPTALGKFRTGGDLDRLDSLRVINCGGEALPTDLRRWTEETLDVVVNEAYGQTEANALVGECWAAYPAREGAMGKPYPGHDVLVVDDDGDPVPDGEVGRIALDPDDPVLFLEYLDDPEATAEAYFDNGLFDTGDLAVRDDDGYLYHRGRADDLIITSGYRVSPLEVENALATHSDVAAAVVAGVPDEHRGERVAAVVVPNGREGDDAFRDELEHRVRDRLGAHKAPREIRFRSTIPETRTGKADRDAVFDR
ncbi:acyl-CoA synthetase [Natrialbaceae archaeon A-arb3/5]